MNADETPRELLEDELVAAYVDGEMEPDQRQRFEARVAMDPALAALVERYRSTVELLRAERSRAAPVAPEFLHAIQRRIRMKSRGHFYGEPRLRFPLEIFAILGMMLVMTLTGLDVFFPAGRGQAVTTSRRAVLDAPVPATLAESLGMEPIHLPDSRETLWSLHLDAAGLPAAQAGLLPLLSGDDRTWLRDLVLGEGQVVRLLLLPREVGFIPVRIEIVPPPPGGGGDREP